MGAEALVGVQGGLPSLLVGSWVPRSRGPASSPGGGHGCRGPSGCLGACLISWWGHGCRGPSGRPGGKATVAL